jgi:glycosyltransferase involved in cell wall biosynthesis
MSDSTIASVTAPDLAAVASRPHSPRLSAFVLTKNEESNLDPCLQSLVPCCDDIHLVDSYSTDRTLEIARKYDAQIHQHAFEGHTKQRTWALKNLPFRHQWVIALDADHRVTRELRNELVHLFANPPEHIHGLFVKRRQIFRGRWIRFGGYYPKYMLKVFRHDAAFLDDDEFDYRFYVKGATAKLQHDILEENRNEWRISFFVEKHNKFATEQATEEVKRRARGQKYLVSVTPCGNPDQRILWLKTIWYKVPLYVRPFLYFFYRYFLRLGFLDGKEGFIFHFLQSFWFRLLVDIRMEEIWAELGKERQKENV